MRHRHELNSELIITSCKLIIIIHTLAQAHLPLLILLLFRTLSQLLHTFPLPVSVRYISSLDEFLLATTYTLFSTTRKKSVTTLHLQYCQQQHTILYSTITYSSCKILLPFHYFLLSLFFCKINSLGTFSSLFLS